MKRRRRARSHDQAAIGQAREGCDAAFDLTRVTHVDWAHVDPDRRGNGLDNGELARAGGDGRIPKYPRPRHLGCDLFEQF